MRPRRSTVEVFLITWLVVAVYWSLNGARVLHQYVQWSETTSYRSLYLAERYRHVALGFWRDWSKLTVIVALSSSALVITGLILVRRLPTDALRRRLCDVRPMRWTFLLFTAVAAATYAATVALYAAALHGSGCCDTLVGALLWLTLPGVVVLASQFSGMADTGYMGQANLLVPVEIIVAPITASFWAALITVAYVAIRRLRERRAASKGV